MEGFRATRESLIERNRREYLYPMFELLGNLISRNYAAYESLGGDELHSLLSETNFDLVGSCAESNHLRTALQAMRGYEQIALDPATRQDQARLARLAEHFYAELSGKKSD